MMLNIIVGILFIVVGLAHLRMGANKITFEKSKESYQYATTKNELIVEEEPDYSDIPIGTSPEHIVKLMQEDIGKVHIFEPDQRLEVIVEQNGHIGPPFGEPQERLKVTGDGRLHI